MPLSVVITEWSLQSYIDLVSSNTITKEDYQRILRPDVVLLRRYPDHEKFKNAKFWGPATLKSGDNVVCGFKMKWHNIGPGKVQLRLCVAMVKGTAFLCQAYVKTSELKDKREANLLLNRIDQIELGRFDIRGRL